MAGFYVGHGRHWEFYRLAGHSDDELMALLQRAYELGRSNVVFDTGGVQLICEPNRELSVAILLRGQQISSAFPYVRGGHVWPMELKDRYEWPVPIEAQLIGSCHGARVAWFDPHYAQHNRRYRKAKEPLPFEMNALAYRVWRTDFSSPEHEQQMGGMKAYMPLSDQGDFQASEDEVQFMSHVEKAWSLDFHGLAFDVYTVTIALPDDFPMRLNVYSPPSASQRRLVVGERISGVCWLFGRLAA